ncbi:MAG: acetolactate synthase small subunit [Gammaproteobacteria bacterium]|nr:acetolactate synthase small subunit [Gammaproteobacteria bacterium]
MRHILSLLVENEAGALSRISGLFSARAFNIESLTVAPTEDESLSRMTIVTTGSDQIIEQITKQVNKLVDVIKVVDLNERAHIERELMLIKLDANQVDIEELETIAGEHNGQIVDNSENAITIEIINTAEALNNFIDKLDKAWILEVVRSGVSGIALGASVINN